jgi:hypothetical protein
MSKRRIERHVAVFAARSCRMKRHGLIEKSATVSNVDVVTLAKPARKSIFNHKPIYRSRASVRGSN